MSIFAIFSISTAYAITCALLITTLVAFVIYKNHRNTLQAINLDQTSRKIKRSIDARL